jgi:ATP phosphoribosyltransferase regulatory subunit
MVGDRPHLPGARLGEGLARLEAEVGRLLAVLGAGDAIRVEPAALQPADVLLDLYGEDIRARAFVTRDDGAEMMLRPDFTVPLARLHMERGAGPAAYVYCGPVWRRQEAGSARSREYLQAGIEVFGTGADETEASAADAMVLARIRAALGDAPVDLVTGDMGLAIAAIGALPTSAARKAALRRHLWRPARFHRLLQRYGADHAVVTAARRDLLEAAEAGRIEAAIAAAGAPVGLRAVAEVAARVARLVEEAATPALDPGHVDWLEGVLAVAGLAPAALERLEALARAMPGFRPAVTRFAARLEAFAAQGIDPAGLRVEAGFGRTTLEYYDGFVFGAVARDRPDLPPVASGGRYDALTRALGGGRAVPAVGGIIRPEVLVALAEGGSCG